MKLKIKRLSENAKLPTRGSAEAACYDLYVSKDTVLANDEPVLVPTDIAMGIPEGFAVKIYGRSSMHKKGVVVQTGIVDSDYTGEIKVQAINVGHALPVVFYRGERIAQFMLVRLEPTEFEETDTLRETARGAAGFGSTGR